MQESRCGVRLGSQTFLDHRRGVTVKDDREEALRSTA